MTNSRTSALIGLLACALTNADYAARQLQAVGNFKHDLKRQLNLFQAQGDKLLLASQALFGSDEVDTIVVLSEALNLHAELFLQLTPDQMQAVLVHMQGLLAANAVYTPA